MEEAKLWGSTTTAALVFLIFYGLVQYIFAKSIEPVSLFIGALAFWLVFFIVQKAMAKHTR
jgi:hypothetical protein